MQAATYVLQVKVMPSTHQVKILIHAAVVCREFDRRRAWNFHGIAAPVLFEEQLAATIDPRG
jgi:hypothetical protein